MKEEKKEIIHQEVVTFRKEIKNMKIIYLKKMNYII